MNNKCWSPIEKSTTVYSNINPNTGPARFKHIKMIGQ